MQSKIATLRGSGYWKLNVSILDNVDVVEVMENIWQQEFDIHPDLDGACGNIVKPALKILSFSCQRKCIVNLMMKNINLKMI